MRRTLCVALGAALLLTGCAGPGPVAAETPAAAGQTGEPWRDEVKPAAKGGDTAACPMPVTFDVAAEWKAEPVQLDGVPAELLQKGGATLVCEVNAKSAGHLAFLRVYTAPGDARAVLAAFLAGDGAGEIAYRDRPSGGVEATYIRTSEVDPEGRRAYATAIGTADGAAVVSLEGVSSSDVQAEYALARESLAAAS